MTLLPTSLRDWLLLAGVAFALAGLVSYLPEGDWDAAGWAFIAAVAIAANYVDLKWGEGGFEVHAEEAVRVGEEEG